MLASSLLACTSFAWGQTAGELSKVLPDDGAPADWFGISIAFDTAIDNSPFAVGAYLDDNANGTDAGAVYLFDAFTSLQLTKLIANDGADADEFGLAVKVSNTIAAIGARKDDDNGINSGSAYIFDTITGNQLLKLLPNDGAPNDNFGHSIDIDNTSTPPIVAIGADQDADNGQFSGSAYLFDANTGSQLAKLLPADGSPNDFFANSIAIENGIVAVGAWQSGDNGPGSGSAYLFDASTGVQIAKLLPDDNAAGDFFGVFVAIDNGIVAIGAINNDQMAQDAGAVYLFDALNGSLIRKLVPNDPSPGSNFGNTIAMHNGLIAIGARADNDNGPASGSAYIFDVNTGNQLAKLLPSDGAPGNLFGFSIAINTNTIAIGSISDNANGTNSGSAYIFDPNTAICPADLTADGTLNFFDVSAFLVAFDAADPIADFTNDGSFNFFDVSAFLIAFGSGCP